MDGPPTDRKAPAEAAASYSRVITIAMEMVAPGLLGIWIDRKVGTEVAFTVGGFVLGMVLGLYQLVAFAREQARKNTQEDPAGIDTTKPHDTNKDNRES